MKFTWFLKGSGKLVALVFSIGGHLPVREWLESWADSFQAQLKLGSLPLVSSLGLFPSPPFYILPVLAHSLAAENQ